MSRFITHTRDYWRTRTREVAKLAGADWTDMADFVRAARGATPAAVIRPECLDAIACAAGNDQAAFAHRGTAVPDFMAPAPARPQPGPPHLTVVRTP